MLGGMGKREEQIHVVLAGGGTAGHVNPLLSVADAIRAQRPNSSITVVGTESGLERDLVPQAGYELETVEKVPFPRALNAAAFAFPGKWFSELRKAKDILRRHHADVVVGFGGYASAPVYRAAKSLHIPIAIHEQNAKAGMANKLGAKWADYVGTVYDGTGLQVKQGATIERVGLPLRPSIARLCKGLDSPRLARVEAASTLGIDPTDRLSSLPEVLSEPQASMPRSQAPRLSCCAGHRSFISPARGSLRRSDESCPSMQARKY
jgi:UDP-N-acetylglucosamine--N-acetylmuramyl-(pentapeptide) pyrophosphoryl-undecaprenol N-acetylglucosamine transferase